MIGSGWLCPVIGHKYEKEWVDAFSPGLGAAEVEVKECQRCRYRIPTGRDRRIEEDQQS